MIRSPFSMEQHAVLTSLIRGVGLRVTDARLWVLGELRREHGPFSAEELYRRKGGSRFDVVTMYRVLQDMDEKGLVRRCDLGDRVARYEFAESHHHHHIVCRRCRSTKPVDLCIPQSLLEEVVRLGFRDVRHSLEFFAICDSCHKKSALGGKGPRVGPAGPR